MLGSERNIEDFEREIRKQIDAQLATGKPRVFLSTLGGNLGKDFILDLEQASGMKLAHFVESRLDYPMGKTGEHNNVFFVVAPGTSPTETTDRTSPRYALSFWTAFAKPLEPGETRFINLETLRFGSLRSAVGDDSDDVREIDPSCVSDEENSRNPNHITRLIQTWLERQSLDPTRFYASQRKSHGSHKSLLDEIIRRLTPDQLKRTILPLDAIKALMD